MASESLGKAVLELGADLGGLKKELAQAKGETDQSAKSMGARFKSGLKAAMVPAIGILAAVGAKAHDAIGDASDLSEEINKASTVFRGSEKGILDWSKTTAKSLGISRREALEFSGVFGNMLVPMGFARSKAADMSKGLVNLAADMASFNNADPKDVLEGLRAGLAGETEPLRKYGVFLNDARLKQEAMNLGLKNAVGPNGALTANAKAQATYSLILKDTKDAQGDFAKTSTGLANSQRIQKAEAEDLNAKLGQSLLPTYEALLHIGLKVIGFTSDHAKETKIAVGVIAALAAGVIAVNVGMKLYSAGAAAVTAAQWLWNASLMGFPLVWVVAAIAAVIAIIVLAVKHWDKIKAATVATWNAIKSATSVAWGAVKSAISAAVSAVKSAVSSAVNAVKSAVSSAWNAVRSATSTAWNAVKSTVTSVGNAIVSWVRSLPGRLVSALGSLVGGLTGAGKRGMGGLREGLGDAVSGVLGLIRGLPGRIVSGLGNLGGLLWGAGRAIIQGLINGIESMLGGLWSKVSGIAGKIKSLKGPLPKDRVLLVEEGQAIIEGLGKGLDSEFARLQGDIAGYAPTIEATFAASRGTAPAAAGSSGSSGPLVNIEHMEVRDAFDEKALASRLAWKVAHA